MKVAYTSIVDNLARTVMIPLAALSTYKRRDLALQKMIEMGGVHAEPTAEFLRQRRIMLAAKRKIEREGWFCQQV